MKSFFRQCLIFTSYLSTVKKTAWYKDWFNSPYYHLLYQNRNDDEAQTFINRLIDYLKPTIGATMLDVACGKGRHSKVLADMGFDVSGIDLSEASIAEAMLDESDNLHFYQHDMRNLFRINYYDYAFNFFTSFGYFKKQRDHNNAIRTITQSIKPQGIFVIDYLNVQYVSDRLEPNVTIVVDEVNFYITKWEDEANFYKQIKISEGLKAVSEHSYTERVAKFSLEDFTQMLARQQTKVIAVFGDYDLGNYDVKRSPRMIIVATKS